VNESIAKRLEERMAEDIRNVRAVLTDLEKRIRERLHSIEQEAQQLTLLFDVVEKQQFEQDAQSLRRRLDEIPGEIEREVAAIIRRYASPTERVFPAAVMILEPVGGEHGR
jgi:hypothetical protein